MSTDMDYHCDTACRWTESKVSKLVDENTVRIDLDWLDEFLYGLPQQCVEQCVEQGPPGQCVEQVVEQGPAEQVVEQPVDIEQGVDDEVVVEQGPPGQCVEQVVEQVVDDEVVVEQVVDEGPPEQGEQDVVDVDEGPLEQGEQDVVVVDEVPAEQGEGVVDEVPAEQGEGVGRRRRRKDFPRSRYKHVYWSARQNKWNVRVKHPITKKQQCGTFVDELEAAMFADTQLFQLYSVQPSLKDKLQFNFYTFLE
jgi:hypothetical protein